MNTDLNFSAYIVHVFPRKTREFRGDWQQHCQELGVECGGVHVLGPGIAVDCLKNLLKKISTLWRIHSHGQWEKTNTQQSSVCAQDTMLVFAPGHLPHAGCCVLSLHNNNWASIHHIILPVPHPFQTTSNCSFILVWVHPHLNNPSWEAA